MTVKAFDKDTTTEIKNRFLLTPIKEKGLVVVAATTGTGKTFQASQMAKDSNKYWIETAEKSSKINEEYRKEIIETIKQSKFRTIYIEPQIKGVRDFITEVTGQNENNFYHGNALRLISSRELAKYITDTIDKKGNQHKEPLTCKIKNATTESVKHLKKVTSEREQLENSNYADEDSELEKELNDRGQAALNSVLKDIKETLKDILDDMKKDSLFQKEKELEKNALREMKRELNISDLSYLCKVHPELEWLKPIFPLDFWHECTCVTFTAKRFLYSIKGLRASHSIYTVLQSTKDIKKNQILLDESDSVAEEWQNYIIEEAAKANNNNDVYFIKAALLQLANHTFPYKNKPIDVEESEFVEKLREKANEKWELFLKQVSETLAGKEMNVSLKSTANLRKAINEDRGLSISAHGRAYEYINFSKEGVNDKRNKILISHGENKESAILSHSKGDVELNDYESTEEINTFVKDVMKTYNFFRQSVFPSIHKYVMEAKRDENISSQQVTKDICKLFFIDPEIMKDLEDFTVMLGTPLSNIKKGNTDYEREFYEDGFKIFLVEPGDAYTSSKISFLKVENTPEKILLRLAKSNMVYLISATANVATVKNFDLGYLEDKLGNDFHEWGKDNKASIESDVNYQQMKETIQFNGEIYDSLPFNNEDKKDKSIETYIDTNLENIFKKCIPEAFKNIQSQKVAESIYSEIREILKSKHGENEISKIKTYLEMIAHFIIFKKHNHTAGLSLFNSILDKDVCHEIIEQVNNLLVDIGHPEKACRIFSCKTENLRDGTTQRKVEEAYLSGDDIFLVTSFQTMSKAVNFTFSPRESNELVFIPTKGRTNIPSRKEIQIGFDFLATGDVRYVFSSYDNQWRTRAYLNQNLLERVFEIEKIREMNALNNNQEREILGRAFLQEGSLHSCKSGSVTGLKANGVYRIISQSAGRLFRTQMFHKNMTFATSSFNANLLGVVAKDFKRKTYTENPLLESLVNRCLDENINGQPLVDELKVFENKANDSSSHLKRIINTMFGGKKKEDVIKAIAEYNSKSNIALTFGPYIDKDTYDYIQKNEHSKPEQMYLKCDEKLIDKVSEGIFYKIDKRGGNEVFQVCSEHKAGYHFYSPAKHNLHKFLSLRGFKEFCQEHEINTSIPSIFLKESDAEEGAYVMNPCIYNNIYKGRLGESVGVFLFEEANIAISRHEDLETFEYCDYYLDNVDSSFIDFKNHKVFTGVGIENKDNLRRLRENIARKAKKLKATNYDLVNVYPCSHENIEKARFDMLNEDGKPVYNLNGDVVKVRYIQATYMDGDVCKTTNTFKEYMRTLRNSQHGEKR